MERVYFRITVINLERLGAVLHLLVAAANHVVRRVGDLMGRRELERGRQGWAMGDGGSRHGGEMGAPDGCSEAPAKNVWGWLLGRVGMRGDGGNPGCNVG